MKKKTKPEVKVEYKFAKQPEGVATMVSGEKRKREYTPEERTAFRIRMVEAKERKRRGSIPEAISTEAAVAPVPVVVEPQTTKKQRHMPTINRFWILAGLAVGLVVLSIFIGSIWLANPTNQILGLASIVLFIGGGWLIRRQIKNRHEILGGTKVNITSTKTSKVDGVAEQPSVSSNGHTPNSVNIYAIKDGDMVRAQRIAFEYTENPLGQPQKCLNTGKFYYVHIWDIDKERLMPFMLPDSKFTDPALMARYLGLPAQKKYLRHRESLMHYVGPGILAVMCIAGFIAIIALSG